MGGGRLGDIKELVGWITAWEPAAGAVAAARLKPRIGDLCDSIPRQEPKEGRRK
jgi:hypothetical protein